MQPGGGTGLVPGPSGRVGAADIDDDGDLDLVTVRSHGNEDDAASVLLNDGDGTFTAREAPAPSTELTDLALGDLDGDGHLDRVDLVREYGDLVRGSIVLHRGDGAGGLGAPSAPVFTSTWNHPDLGGMNLADIDEDGALDVVGVNYGYQGAVWWLAGDGDGGLAPVVPSPAAGGSDLDVGDIDGDGHLDVVTATQQGSGGTVLYGDGAGHFGDAHPLSGDRGPEVASVVVAPLDAGTSPDVVFGRGAWNIPSDTAVLLSTSGGRRQH